MAMFDVGKFKITAKNPDGTNKVIGTAQSVSFERAAQPIRELGKIMPSAYTHPGVSMEITDASFHPDGIRQAFSMGTVSPAGTITMYSGIVPDFHRYTTRLHADDFKKVDPRTIKVQISNQPIHKDDYYIDIDGKLTLNKPSNYNNVPLIVTAQDEVYEHVMRSKVLILATSKLTPYHRLQEFVPELFEPISINHLRKFPDNKHHIQYFDESPEEKAYVYGYEIGKRGIYATVKIYRDIFRV